MKKKNDFAASLTKEELQKEITKKSAALERLKKKAKISEQSYAREFQIEVALEKVRAVAMGMMKPDDMLDVCKIISQQLDLLNVKEIRNVQTAIFYPERSTYMNYEYYAKHDKTFITETSYTNSPMHLAFAEQMQKGYGEEFVSHIKADEVIDWIAYQKTTNVFIDDFLYSATSLSYYWFSLGPVALGTSTYEPLKETDKGVFKRFVKVFEFAYRRYLDIEKAFAQAKESQIEVALERVRARTMAMQKSEELADTASVLFQQIKDLGFETWSCGFCTWQKNNFVEVWMGADSGGLLPPMLIPYKEEPTHHKIYEASFKNQTSHHYIWEGKALEAHYAFLKTIPSVNDAINILEKSGLSLPERQCYYVGFFEQGYLLLITKDPNDELKNLSKRFASVFEQTYTRFLDLQKAEAQARESQIQLALERARAQSMMMQHSTELDDTLRVFHEQVLLLGIPSAFSFLWLPEEEKDRHIFWAAWAQNKTFKSKAIDYPLDRNEPATKQCLIDWKGNEPVVSYHVPPDGVAGYFAAWSELITGVEELKPGNFGDGLYYIEAFMKYGCFGVIVKNTLGEDEKQILDRFATEFERAYTRFLDLQKAEAQAREAQIEAALERVRSRSMGMQKSEELSEVIQIVYDQFIQLNIPAEHTGFVMNYKTRDDYNLWIADRFGSPSQVTIPYFDSIYYNSFNEAKENGIDFFSTKLSFEEKNKFYEELFKHVPGLPEESQEIIFKAPGYSVSTVLLENVSLYIENFTGIPFIDEENAILMRFGKVFQQTYTRFNDLKQAEAQAREAKIEASLEKVRSRSLAMHKSNELQEVVNVVFERLKALDIDMNVASIFIFREDSKDWQQWVATSTTDYSTYFHLPYVDNVIFRDLEDAKQSKKDFYTVRYSYEQKNDWFRYAFLNTEYSRIPVERQSFLIESEFYNVAFALANHTGLQLCKYSGDDFSANDHEIMKRFLKVFEQAYIRFLDLQKAETQAREAQIEAALEKVRSRSLAMHQSGELIDVIAVMFEKLRELNVLIGTIGIWLFDRKTMNSIFWVGNALQEPAMINLPYDEKLMEEDTNYRDSWQAWLSGEKYINKEYSLEQKNKYFNYVFANNDFNAIPAAVRETILHAQKHTASIIIEKNSALFVDSWNGETYNEASINVLKRTAKVFEQAYVRFLDLQKAEAQSRESQIELSLERVRAKTMAMHNSADVGETAAVMVEELKKLDIETIRCGIGIMHEPGDMEVWTISTDENNKTDIIIGWLDMNMHPLLHGAFESWRNKIEAYYYDLKDDDLLSYYNSINNYPGYPIRYDTTKLPKQIHHNEFHFAEGTLFAFSLKQLTEEQRKIFKRFAGVFGQTYRRYLDLKRAEAQAKESQIEAALERVRSRTLAMQKSDELAETSAVLFKQLISLGVEPHRLYISIMKDDNGESEFWITDEEGSKVSSAYTDNLNSNVSFKKMFDGWKADKLSMIIDMQGEELKNYFQHLASLGVPFKDRLKQKRRIQHIAYFNRGFIGMAAPDDQPEDTIRLLERFAAVFNLTFTRFNDLKIAEAHAIQAEEDLIKLQTQKQRAEDALSELKETQKQLIQSEKMASLGELTAGIAHEIQNPLNFVNNFSEVNKELIEELKIKNAKLKIEDEEVNELLNDIKDNEEKINHHGKRADTIVKGMLQHSQSGKGQKEPTDINALADEYLRLSFHGMRAKNKDFNATLVTDFDENIGNINVIPQDISRVLLNLYNNAFYAVKEKRVSGVRYEPTVSVSTRKTGNSLTISVSDNGNGIPQNIINKIFQPFFTTKPTGQGTGLGLSLSYDIIKAHGGEIKVESKEGDGTEFIIQLPFA